MDIKEYMKGLGQQARAASRAMARANTGAKNAALLYIADAIEAAKTYTTEAIRHSFTLGKGHGPTDHFYFLQP